jgi:hypothetical protein
MKQILLFLFAILLITSCAKKRTAVVKGRVLNPVTGEGISNAKITIYHSKLTSYDNEIKVDAQTFSASDGSFEISSKGFKAYELACVLEGDYYYLRWLVDGEYKSSFQPLEGKTQEVDFHAVPYGELQINIMNTNCFDNNDELSIYRTHSISGFYDNVPNPAIYNGCIDQVGNKNKAPMGWYKFHGTVTKNGIETSIADSIYLNEGQTFTWNINY